VSVVLVRPTIDNMISYFDDRKGVWSVKSSVSKPL